MTLTTERRHALAPATIQTLIRRATDQEIADAIPADELDQADVLDLVAAVRTARIAVSWPGDDVTCHDQPAPLDVDGLMRLIEANATAAVQAAIAPLGDVPERHRRAKEAHAEVRRSLETLSAARSVGRCGNRAPGILPGTPAVCELDAGHAGWHREGATEWSDTTEPATVDDIMQLVYGYAAATICAESAFDAGDSTSAHDREARDIEAQIRATLASITPAAPSPATPSAEDRGRGLAAALRLVDLLDLAGLDLHDVEQAAIGSARRLAEWISTGNETAWQPPATGTTLTVPDGTGQETASPATESAEQPPGAHQDTPDPWRLDLDAIEARANAACPGPWGACNANEGTTSMPSWEVANDAYHSPSSDDDEPWIAVHVETGRREDAEFIAHARQDVPALIAEVRALRAAVDQRTQALRTLAELDAALSAATTTLEAQQ